MWLIESSKLRSNLFIPLSVTSRIAPLPILRRRHRRLGAIRVPSTPLMETSMCLLLPRAIQPQPTCSSATSLWIAWISLKSRSSTQSRSSCSSSSWVSLWSSLPDSASSRSLNKTKNIGSAWLSRCLILSDQHRESRKLVDPHLKVPLLPLTDQIIDLILLHKGGMIKDHDRCIRTRMDLLLESIMILTEDRRHLEAIITYIDRYL